MISTPAQRLASSNLNKVKSVVGVGRLRNATLMHVITYENLGPFCLLWPPFSSPFSLKTRKPIFASRASHDKEELPSEPLFFGLGPGALKLLRRKG